MSIKTGPFITQLAKEPMVQDYYTRKDTAVDNKAIRGDLLVQTSNRPYGQPYILDSTVRHTPVTYQHVTSKKDVLDEAVKLKIAHYTNRFHMGKKDLMIIAFDTTGRLHETSLQDLKLLAKLQTEQVNNPNRAIAISIERQLFTALSINLQKSNTAMLKHYCSVTNDRLAKAQPNPDKAYTVSFSSSC